MTALLTDNLPLLASAPNGIRKLRELILELALSGKLVPQNPKDEPARELLKRIAEEKVQLVAEGAIKKQKPFPDIETLETPYALPTGWEWTTLPGAANYQVGKTPPTKEAKYWDDSGLPWVCISDMEHYGEVTDTARRVSEIARKDVFKYPPVPAGTLLMSFKLTIGKVAVLGIDAYHNEAIISISPYTGVSREYLFRFLPSIARGGQQKNALMGNTLNSESMAQLLVPIPPLAEQYRIVAKVDELMALCDRLEARQTDAENAHTRLVQALLDSLSQASDPSDFAVSWQHLAEHFHTLFTTESSIDALKQSLLQLAVMGKLTNSEILTHLQIQDVALLVDGDRGKNYPKAHDYLPDGYCLYLSTKNVRNGYFEFFEKQFISEEKHKLLRNGKLERGDVVITTRGTLGNTAWYSDSIPYDTVRINSGMLIIRCSPEIITPDFLVKYIQSPVFDRQLQEMRTGSAQPQIPAGILKKFSLPIFSISDQHQIVAKVDQLLSLCDQLKKRLIQARRLNEQLANTLVEDAGV